jgi:hypothetical protein
MCSALPGEGNGVGIRLICLVLGWADVRTEEPSQGCGARSLGELDVDEAVCITHRTAVEGLSCPHKGPGRYVCDFIDRLPGRLASEEAVDRGSAPSRWHLVVVVRDVLFNIAEHTGIAEGRWAASKWPHHQQILQCGRRTCSDFVEGAGEDDEKIMPLHRDEEQQEERES